MRNQKSRVQECKGEHIDLIPGMPDDVAVDCLARVPHASFRSMRGVCRGWNSAATAPDFALARAEAGANEDLVYLLQFGNPAAADADGVAPENAQAYGVSVYNVTTGEWRREGAAPPVPMFAQCAAVGSRLAVLGGWDPKTFEPVADVHVLDASTGVWRRGAPMRSARSFFACAEAGGKIYVAGGHDKLKNALKTAEAYDAGADAWDPLPDMSEERDECDGMATVAGDRFLAVSGYRTGRQGGFERDAEWFDPASREWRRLERVRAPPSAAHVVVRGRVWCIEGTAVMEYRGERRSWREVGPSPPGLKAGTARAVAVGGGERVVVTGAIESEGGGTGHALWVFDVKSKNWTVVRPPPQFAGFVFSIGSVRV
ncbi:F-box/kelch-repeat protein At2g44130-like [Triticum dicoccoides]|uniref:F-box/kelch-repeat protein At2g44130-like n=1 Tax=Triticum dicoccoides TaxID=85692 RepID=UPI0018908064|nr:F-box/kelch-repeat protein At2g44130-like [Triticum dicoccoides]